MADETIDVITTLLQEIVHCQREIAAVLREMKEDIRDLSDRLDRMEKSLAADQRSPPVHPELPE
jgi:hypothetical protein